MGGEDLFETSPYALSKNLASIAWGQSLFAVKEVRAQKTPVFTVITWVGELF
jgi:hypothetical protein